MFISSLINNPLGFVIFAAVLLFTLSIHEYAHARVADELGDPTARLMGRLTLNPIAHVDPLGMLLLFLVGFGWGKPVPFDPFNLNKPRRDAALISLAGPMSNFIIALICSMLLRMLNLVELPILKAIGYSILQSAIFLNIMLGVFNLLPFSPLDGFKIVGGVLSEKQAREWYGLERYGLIFLLFFILPLSGGRSMLEIFVLPVIQNTAGLLIP